MDQNLPEEQKVSFNTLLHLWLSPEFAMFLVSGDPSLGFVLLTVAQVPYISHLAIYAPDTYVLTGTCVPLSQHAVLYGGSRHCFH